MRQPVRQEFIAADSDWDTGHPYAWRCWVRGHLPWFLIDLGVVAKGEDCEKVGAWHRWYNQDGNTSGCYHCEVVRPGQLWKQADANETQQPV